MKIFVVGTSNYTTSAQTAVSAGNNAPVIYTKADSALLKDRKPFFIPDDMGRIGCSAELAVRICRLGKEVPERFAHRYYDAFTVGLNFIATDMLRACQSKGLPWTVATGFDGSAIIGDWVSKDSLSSAVEFSFNRNGEQLFSAKLDDMLISIDKIISYLSHFFTLKTGDILFTGSVSSDFEPQIDDFLEGSINGNQVLECRCK